MLTVKNLCKSFQGKDILKNISFEQPPGSIGVFIGSSGSGKSTLFRVLNNLEPKDSGEIFLENNKLQADDLHKKHLMTLVFQGFDSFNNLNVLENVSVGLKYSKKKIKGNVRNSGVEIIRKISFDGTCKTLSESAIGRTKATTGHCSSNCYPT